MNRITVLTVLVMGLIVGCTPAAPPPPVTEQPTATTPPEEMPTEEVVALTPPPMPEVTFVVEMTLTSTAFSEGEAIPADYRSGPIFGCDGDDVSPPFSWSGVPAGTQSLALIMADFSFAPPFVHWTVYNMSVSMVGLAEGIPHEAVVPALIPFLQGELFPGSGEIGYFGPCPPPGETHTYLFALYALDITLDLEAGVDNDDVLAALEQAAAEGHVLGQGELTATYTG